MKWWWWRVWSMCLVILIIGNIMDEQFGVQATEAEGAINYYSKQFGGKHPETEEDNLKYFYTVLIYSIESFDDDLKDERTKNPSKLAFNYDTLGGNSNTQAWLMKAEAWLLKLEILHYFTPSDLVNKIINKVAYGAYNLVNLISPGKQTQVTSSGIKADDLKPFLKDLSFYADLIFEEDYAQKMQHFVQEMKAIGTGTLSDDFKLGREKELLGTVLPTTLKYIKRLEKDDKLIKSNYGSRKGGNCEYYRHLVLALMYQSKEADYIEQKLVDFMKYMNDSMGFEERPPKLSITPLTRDVVYNRIPKAKAKSWMTEMAKLESPDFDVVAKVFDVVKDVKGEYQVEHRATLIDWLATDFKKPNEHLKKMSEHLKKNVQRACFYAGVGKLYEHSRTKAKDAINEMLKKIKFMAEDESTTPLKPDILLTCTFWSLLNAVPKFVNYAQNKATLKGFIDNLVAHGFLAKPPADPEQWTPKTVADCKDVANKADLRLKLHTPIELRDVLLPLVEFTTMAKGDDKIEAMPAAIVQSFVKAIYKTDANALKTLEKTDEAHKNLLATRRLEFVLGIWSIISGEKIPTPAANVSGPTSDAPPLSWKKWTWQEKYYIMFAGLFGLGGGGTIHYILDHPKIHPISPTADPKTESSTDSRDIASPSKWPYVGVALLALAILAAIGFFLYKKQEAEQAAIDKTRKQQQSSELKSDHYRQEGIGGQKKQTKKSPKASSTASSGVDSSAVSSNASSAAGSSAANSVATSIDSSSQASSDPEEVKTPKKIKKSSKKKTPKVGSTQRKKLKSPKKAKKDESAVSELDSAAASSAAESDSDSKQKKKSLKKSPKKAKKPSKKQQQSKAGSVALDAESSASSKSDSDDGKPRKAKKSLNKKKKSSKKKR